MPQEKTAAARPRRRWLQFKLRTLLVAMVAACIPLAWLTMKRERTRRQRRAVVAISNVGGNVWYVGTPKRVPPVGVMAGGGRTLRHNVIPYDSQQRSGNLLAQVVEEATAGDGKTGVTFAGASAFEQDLPRSPIIR